MDFISCADKDGFRKSSHIYGKSECNEDYASQYGESVQD